jgi:hypothetical protein
MAATDKPQHVGGVVFEHNRLEGVEGARTAVGTGKLEHIPCSLLMRSVGYRSVPLQVRMRDCIAARPLGVRHCINVPRVFASPSQVSLRSVAVGCLSASSPLSLRLPLSFVWPFTSLNALTSCTGGAIRPEAARGPAGRRRCLRCRTRPRRGTECRGWTQLSKAEFLARGSGAVCRRMAEARPDRCLCVQSDSFKQTVYIFFFCTHVLWTPNPKT